MSSRPRVWASASVGAKAMAVCGHCKAPDQRANKGKRAEQKQKQAEKQKAFYLSAAAAAANYPKQLKSTF